MEQQELSFIADGSAKWYSPLEDSLEVFTKLYIHLPYDPAITLLVFTQELKTGPHNALASVFIAALFIVLKLRCNQDVLYFEWLNKLNRYIQTIEYYLAKKEKGKKMSY